MADAITSRVGLVAAGLAVLALLYVLVGPPSRRRRRVRGLVDLVVSLALAAAAAYLIQAYVAKPYRIPTPSMVPTLELRDRIVAARFLYRFTDPKRGDILVLHPNGRGREVIEAPTASTATYVKRLVGLPGEWIRARGGRVSVCTGVRRPTGCHVLREPYVSSRQGSFGPIKIPRDRYFVMGDNRAASYDSVDW